jgi:ornithine lipid ester-linked acyl 2-hydroxylase
VKTNSNKRLATSEAMIMVSSTIKILIRKFEFLISRFSRVDDTPFLDTKQFDWIIELESNWIKIRQELDNILENIDDIPNFQEISKRQYLLTQDNLWKTFFLYAYGIKNKKNCEICPETTLIIENIPAIKTAFFSILMPHKHIPKHRGVYKGVLRCHLGLIVPQLKNSCGICVGQDVLHWEEGKCLVFDDSYPHEAWNDSSSIRVVLFLDFIRPMHFPFSVINMLIIKLISWSPLIREAKKRLYEWNEYLERSKNLSK